MQGSEANDLFAETNRRVYDTGRYVKYWASYSTDLLAAEEALLRRLEPAIRNRAVIDVGVGAGRTTPHLLKLTDDYHGVDISSAMIAACRQRYPQARFSCCDARAMRKLGEDRYHLVFFSFNGIDLVGHADRQRIYSEVSAMLVAGGYFLFSAHNLREFRSGFPKPWRPRAGAMGSARSAKDVARFAYHYVLGNANYFRLRRFQASGDGYALMLDPGQEFRSPTYYVDPAEQVRQLVAAGFVDIGAFDRTGCEQQASSAALDGVSPVHYLARKPS